MQDTTPKRFVFLLMPFHEDFDDVYKLGIKPACQDAGAYCERVDEQTFQGSILQRIYNQIAKGDLIVADMTGRNPNVFYETGYAHALGKRVILVTQDSNDIPFDLKHYVHIIYEGKIALLKDKLEPQVAWHLDQPEAPLLESRNLLHFFFDNKRIIDGLRLVFRPKTATLLPSGRWQDITLSLSLKIHNPLERSIDAAATSLALLLPAECAAAVQDLPLPAPKQITLPDERLFVQCARLRPMLPLDWDAKSLSLKLRLPGPEVRHNLECSLRILSPAGTTDIPFTVEVLLPSDAG